MSKYKTEEDVRTKLIYKFLNLNIDDDFIYLEKSISIQLGTKELKAVKLSGRIDILVKSKNGDNLLVWEVKKTGHEITPKDIQQGLSYARLITGNLTPVTVITNGSDTLALDTITGKEIDDCNIDLIKKMALNYFPDEERNSLMNSALDILIQAHPIELTSDFFHKQVSNKTIHLKGKDKKFDQNLYVPIANDIPFSNADNQSNIYLISGKPQSGKTNFLIHTLDNLQAQGALCLFYSAFRISSRLVIDIQTDFDEYFGTSILNHAIHFKNIAETQNVYLIIDGLNEVNYLERESIVSELNKYFNMGINLIISCSDMFISSLFQDQNENPSIFKDIKYKDKITKIDVSLNIVQKLDEIYEVYSKEFNITVPHSHLKSENIYLLRLFMEENRGGILPDDINENDIIELFLDKKCTKLDQRLKLNTNEIMKELAIKTIETVEPIKEYDFFKAFTNCQIFKCPSEFISDALLVVSDGRNPKLGFYYDGVRDFLLLEIFFESNNFYDGLKRIIQKKNKDVVNSVIYKKMIIENIPYNELMNLSDAIFKDIFQVASTILSKKPYLTKLEAKHYLENTVAFYQNGHTDQFRISFDFISNNFHKFKHFNEEACQIFGYFIALNSIEDVYSSCDFLHELVCPEPTGSSDCYYYLTFIMCNIQGKEPLLQLKWLNKAYLNILDIYKLDAGSQLIITVFIIKLIDFSYNYSSIYCRSDNYLKALIEDRLFTHTQSEIEETIAELENTLSAIELETNKGPLTDLLDDLNRLV